MGSEGEASSTGGEGRNWEEVVKLWDDENLDALAFCQLVWS